MSCAIIRDKGYHCACNLQICLTALDMDRYAIGHVHVYIQALSRCVCCIFVDVTKFNMACNYYSRYLSTNSFTARCSQLEHDYEHSY